MRYIRTKDGRIVDTEKEYQELEWEKEARDYALTIAQSDTIEELCDEVVVEIKFGSTGYIAHLNKPFEELKKFLEYLEKCKPITKDEILNVYGAIWTDKGLIYVAKINGNGEFELL